MNHKANQETAKHLRAIREQLSRLEEVIEQAEGNVADNACNWGDAGSAEHILELVQQAADFATGSNL